MIIKHSLLRMSFCLKLLHLWKNKVSRFWVITSTPSWAISIYISWLLNSTIWAEPVAPAIVYMIDKLSTRLVKSTSFIKIMGSSCCCPDLYLSRYVLTSVWQLSYLHNEPRPLNLDFHWGNCHGCHYVVMPLADSSVDYIIELAVASHEICNTMNQIA